MSERDGQPLGDPPAMPEESPQGGAAAQHLAAPGISAGLLLRQAREAAGLHIAALAVSLKVPVKKLEALEADRLDLLPDAVFVRALAASVCRTLKIDAGQVLALLPHTGKPRLDYQHTSINTPFRSPSDGPGPSLWAQMSRPAVLGGLLLLLGALVLIFLPAVQRLDPLARPATEPSAVAPLPANSSVLEVPQSAQSGVAMATVELLGSTRAAPAEVPAASAVSAAVVVAAPASAANPLSRPALAVPVAVAPKLPASAAGSTAPATETPTPAVATGIIVFKAKGASWVEVTDAKGIVVLRRTLAPGEVVGASGALPLAAVVGRVDATQVQVRGQAFDLNAVSKDNVARFEVK